MKSFFGPMYLYERIAGDTLPFNPKSIMSLHLYCWCVLSTLNESFDTDIEFEKFIILLNDLSLAASLRDMALEQISELTAGSKNTPADKKNKKKV